MRHLTSILAAGLLAITAGSAPAQPSGDAMGAPATVAAPASDSKGRPSSSPLTRRIADAVPGATIEVEPGVYRGTLRIDKPVKLIGKGRPVLDAGGHGDVVEILAEGVEIRGFVIRGTGIDLDAENVGVRVLAAGAVIEDNRLADVLFGIDCKSAPRCKILNNLIGGKDLDIARRGDGIRLWRSDGTLIESNTIRDGRDAILWYSKGVTVRGNICERCRYGFHLMYSNDVTLEGNTLTGNSVGVYFMYSTGVTLRDNRILHNRGPSGYGIGLKDTDAFTIENNLIAGNRVGIYMDNSPVVRTGKVLIARNTLATNDTGMQLLPSVKGNTLTENSFLDNFEQVGVLGRGAIDENDFERDGRGNFWSDYGGYDLDGNGVGESSYEARRLFEHMTAREPKLRLWLFSPAQQAVEFVARAVPAVQPEPTFEDLSPLVRPAGCTLPAGIAVTAAPMWLTGISLLGAAGASVACALLSLKTTRRARADRSATTIQGAPA